jgi:hypothetical protein
MNKQLLQVQNVLGQGGILICFCGRLSQGLIEEYGQAVKAYLETEDRPTNQIFNVFSIFIEQTQNIKNYSAVKEGSDQYERIVQSAIVTIGKNEAGYFISCGNLVASGDIPQLAEALDKLIGLDKEGLKRLYKDKLRQELPPGAASAGLGLVDIARKASLPLEYSVTAVDEALTFFTLKAIV